MPAILYPAVHLTAVFVRLPRARDLGPAECSGRIPFADTAIWVRVMDANGTLVALATADAKRRAVCTRRIALLS